MNRLSDSFPTLDKLPKTQELAKLGKLGRIRETLLPPERDPLEQQTADTFPTQAEFDSAYDKWGQGTKAEFAVYRNLTTRQHLEAGRDFQFISSGMTSSLSVFYVGRAAWRIRGDAIIDKPSTMALQKISLTRQGYNVVDLHAQDLQFGLSDRTISEALHGREVRSF